MFGEILFRIGLEMVFFKRSICHFDEGEIARVIP
ncbi:hypothetical protein FLCH110379_09010 [Flavobacterium chungbukense]